MDPSGFNFRADHLQFQFGDSDFSLAPFANPAPAEESSEEESVPEDDEETVEHDVEQGFVHARSPNTSQNARSTAQGEEYQNPPFTSESQSTTRADLGLTNREHQQPSLREHRAGQTQLSHRITTTPRSGRPRDYGRSLSVRTGDSSPSTHARHYQEAGNGPAYRQPKLKERDDIGMIDSRAPDGGRRPRSPVTASRRKFPKDIPTISVPQRSRTSGGNRQPITPSITVEEPQDDSHMSHFQSEMVYPPLYSDTPPSPLWSTHSSMNSRKGRNRSESMLSTTSMLSASPSARESIYSAGSNEDSIASPTLQVPDAGRDRNAPRSLTRPKIRDTSRSRTVAGAAAVIGDGGMYACRMCRQHGGDRWYCDRCRVLFCEDCWSKQPLHQPQDEDQDDDMHERTDARIADKVRAILAPKLSDQHREQLHDNDIGTTWFGVVREDDGSLPLFRDYGHYAELIATLKRLRQDLPPASATSVDESDILYPSLVSFVGQTGAGKSTLIKLLIDLATRPGDPDFPTPVVGKAGVNNPTSEDVHLYLDPASCMSSASRAPLLFADGEGLRGGERDPTGAILRMKRERQAKSERATKPGRRQPVLKHTSERELLWATTSAKRARSYAVATLYPRLLYTFSDVIVFVEQNQRTLEDVLQRLVEWADAALEKSSNQPVLPHAIIALNQSSHSIDVDLWDVDTASSTHLESISLDLKSHPVFQKHVELWRERGRDIDTIAELLISYYSSIRVIHIPAHGKPNLILKQINKLYEEIHSASQMAREQKASLRMLLDADDFQPYLELAFDHFARDLNMPFDFVQASLASSPIPHNFGGNILKLAIQVMACWEDTARGHTIFEELDTVVASCIMLDAARCRIRGSPEDIFSSRYLEHVDNALENFCKLHWPCEYHDERRGRCVNVRSGHGKGHQLKDGRVLAGNYQSEFSFDSYRDTFEMNVYSKLRTLHEMVQVKIKELGTDEEKAAAEVHLRSVLPTFIERASLNNPKAFVSHTVCFACLFEPPEHALPCGHIVCTLCLRTYGSVANRYVEIARCPMEKPDRHWREAWKVRLAPASCGVRVLSLDGGGVRGIVELEILRHIEKEFDNGISVQSFFDLIVGTSTGGIIALGLTARNWSLQECTHQFETLCKQAFTLRKGANMPVVGTIVENYNHGKYETRPLQDALIGAFTKDQYLFGGERQQAGSLDIKVAVTATSGAGAVVFANYNRLCLEKLNYIFQRPEHLKAEVKTWEAARATAAAPSYFKPFHHEPTRQILQDGGLYHNNPIRVAEQERKLIMPEQRDAEPDIVVAIGTAFCSKSDKDAEKMKPVWRPESKGLLQQLISHYNLARDHIRASLRSESTWNDFINDKRSPSKERYIRLNPDLDEPPPKMDDVSRLEFLKEVAANFARDNPRIQEVAKRLVAASFYFELDERPSRDSTTDEYEVTGRILCRFTEKHEIKELGKYLKRMASLGYRPNFVIKDSDPEYETHQPISLDGRVLDRMLKDNIFRLTSKLTIRRSHQQAITDISLVLKQSEGFPISGFPRQLQYKRSGSRNHRSGASAAENFRWVGRSASFRDRRNDWKPSPDWSHEHYNEARDHVQRYAESRSGDSTTLLGRATEADLMPTRPGTHGNTIPAGLLSRASSFSVAFTDSQPQRQLRRSRTVAGFSPPAEGARTRPSLESLASITRSVPAIHEQKSEPEAQPNTSDESSSSIREEAPQAWFFVARADRPAQSVNELSLRQYDIIRITEMTPGWWRGQRSPTEDEGWMPSNFLVPASAHAPAAFLQALPSTSDVPVASMANQRSGHNTLTASNALRGPPSYQPNGPEVEHLPQRQFQAYSTRTIPESSNAGGLRRMAAKFRKATKRPTRPIGPLTGASNASLDPPPYHEDYEEVHKHGHYEYYNKRPVEMDSDEQQLKSELAGSYPFGEMSSSRHELYGSSSQVLAVNQAAASSRSDTAVSSIHDAATEDDLYSSSPPRQRDVRSAELRSSTADPASERDGSMLQGTTANVPRLQPNQVYELPGSGASWRPSALNEEDTIHEE